MQERHRRKLVDILSLKILTELKKEKDENYDPLVFDERLVKYYLIVPYTKESLRFSIKLNKKYLEEYIKLKEMKRVEFEGRFDLRQFLASKEVKEEIEKKRAKEKVKGKAKGKLELESEPLSREIVEKFREKYGEMGATLAKKIMEVTDVDIGLRTSDIERIVEKFQVSSYRSQIEQLKERPITYNIYEFRDTIREVFGEEIETTRVFIEFDEENYEIRYIIEDMAEMSKYEEKIFRRLLTAIEETPGYITTIDELSKSEYSNKQQFVEMYIVKWINELWNILNISVPTRRSKFKILVNLLRELVGYKHLTPLFYDKENIEDISYVEVRSPIRVRYRLFSDWVPVYVRSLKTKKIRPLTFKTISEANEFIRILAQKAGQYVNVAMPIVDGRLPDNSRLHAKYSTTITAPEKGPTFTIRLKRERVILPLDLMLWRTLSPDMMAFAWMTVEVIPTASIVVAGTTGAGKTTTLQAVLMFIPPSAKILSIEDTPELKLPHPHWEATYTLESTYSKNKITMFDLVKGALRERPDYIIVQEVRGSEAMYMFHAMASGHAALTTFHAGSFEEVVNRFINDPINVPKTFMASTLKQIWIQKIVPSDVPGLRLARKVIEMWEVGGLDENGEIIGYKLFKYDFVDRKFYATETFGERFIDPESILYQLVYQMGFESPYDLIEEFKLRKEFLIMLTYLYKIYSDKNIQTTRLTVDQKRVVDEVLEFWKKYEVKNKGDLAKMFFDILFEYRVNRDQLLPLVTNLYSKVMTFLKDIVGVVLW